MNLARRDFMKAAALGAAGISFNTPAAEPAGAVKGRIKQSFTFGTFIKKNMDPELVIKKAKAIGYQSIEMGPEEHWDKIKAAGLNIAIFVGHKELKDGMNDKKNFDRIEKELRESIAKAEKYKIPSILCLSGNRNGKSDEEGIENTVACAKRVIKAAEDKGINLCIELLNSKVNHPDYQCDHTAWGVEVCKRVGSPNMKVLYDIYHMQIMEGDLIRTLKDNIKFIGHFHTAGNPGRNDINDTQEIYYPAVMKAIVETGYQGYVGHEFGTKKKDPLEAMEEAFKICDV